MSLSRIEREKVIQEIEASVKKERGLEKKAQEDRVAAERLLFEIKQESEGRAKVLNGINEDIAKQEVILKQKTDEVAAKQEGYITFQADYSSKVTDFENKRNTQIKELFDMKLALEKTQKEMEQAKVNFNNKESELNQKIGILEKTRQELMLSKQKSDEIINNARAREAELQKSREILKEREKQVEAKTSEFVQREINLTQREKDLVNKENLLINQDKVLASKLNEVANKELALQAGYMELEELRTKVNHLITIHKLQV